MVGIVILNYNSIKNTCRCIDTIYKYCIYDAYKLVVVDNASNLDVRESVFAYLEEKYGQDLKRGTESDFSGCLPHLSYVLSGKNMGYANGNNIGLKLLQNDDNICHYLILNNDILLTMDILTPMVEYLKANKTCGVVSPLLYSKEGIVDYECARREKGMANFLAKFTLLNRIKRIKEIDANNRILRENPTLLRMESVSINLPSGSCMMFPKNVFDEIGHFDKGTFLYYEEDILWSKLKEKYKSVLLPQISCVHLGAGCTSKSPSKFIMKCYRESMLYYIKNFTCFPFWFVSYIQFRSWLSLILKK